MQDTIQTGNQCNYLRGSFSLSLCIHTVADNLHSLRLMTKHFMLLKLLWKQHNVLRVTYVLVCAFLKLKKNRNTGKFSKWQNQITTAQRQRRCRLFTELLRFTAEERGGKFSHQPAQINHRYIICVLSLLNDC